MKQIYTCASDINGIGIRVGESVKKGETVFCIKGVPKFKTNKSKKDAISNPDWVGIAKNKWIDPYRPYKFLNHSCNPNTGIKGRVTLVALRDIQAGEEITIDYSTIEGDPLWEMECTCGGKNCRGTIRSVQFIPNEQFQKYLPYVSTYFKELFLKHHRKSYEI